MVEHDETNGNSRLIMNEWLLSYEERHILFQ